MLLINKQKDYKVTRLHRNQLGFSAVEGLLILIIVILIGGVGYYVYNSNQATAKRNITGPTSEVKSDDKMTTQLKTTSLTYRTTTVTVKHPTNWIVKDKTKKYEGSPALPAISILSNNKYYLHFFTSSGVGGSCESNDYKYTLTKKIATAAPNIFFSEYTTSDSKNPKINLSLEDFSIRDPKNTTNAVGDSATDSCTMSRYAVVGKASGDDVFVTISTKEAISHGGDVAFADLANDPDFVKMLESLNVN